MSELTKEMMVELVKEINNVMNLTGADAIKTDSKQTEKTLLKEIRSISWEFSYTDFDATIDPDAVTFSETAKNTLVACGVAIPQPPTPATGSKPKKEKVIQYTRQTAFVDALKAGKGTKEELVKRAHEMYIARHPESPKVSTSKHSAVFVAEVQFRYTMQCFVLMGVVEYDNTTKIYSEIVPSIEEVETTDDTNNENDNTSDENTDATGENE